MYNIQNIHSQSNTLLMLKNKHHLLFMYSLWPIRHPLDRLNKYTLDIMRKHFNLAENFKN